MSQTLESALIVLTEPAPIETIFTFQRTFRPRSKSDEFLITPSTNVPWSVIQHSPSGFNWGYRGSGPADLALNILNWMVPPGHDGWEPVKCYQGVCSWTAWAYHQEVKERFVARLPPEGGRIPLRDIHHYLMAQAPTVPADYDWQEVCSFCRWPKGAFGGPRGGGEWVKVEDGGDEFWEHNHGGQQYATCSITSEDGDKPTD